MIASDEYYMKKLDIVVDLVKKIYDLYGSENKLCNVIYVDGGECTGTTSVVKGVCDILKDRVIRTREPSEQCKQTTINKYIKQGQLIDPGRFIGKIIDCFMEDRYYNQEYTEQLKVSDRGIFSTIVYQSGLLKSNSTINDVIRNCDYILYSFKFWNIKLPKIAVNFISLNEDYDNDIKVFQERLERRRRGEQALDYMDEIDIMLNVTKVYTDITLRCLEMNNPRIIALDHKNPLDTMIQSVVDIINTIEK